MLDSADWIHATGPEAYENREEKREKKYIVTEQ